MPDEAALRAALARAGLAGEWIARGRGAPQLKGSYALAIRLDAPLRLASGRFRGKVLPGGWYVYCGSANGPGGLRARLTRHLKKRKKRRWHIDWLTTQSDVRRALCLPGAEECALVARPLDTGAFTIPLPGFGSSDCASCESHLLRWMGAETGAP